MFTFGNTNCNSQNKKNMQDKQSVTVYVLTEEKSNDSLYSGKNVDEFICYLENKKGYFLTPEEWKSIQTKIKALELQVENLKEKNHCAHEWVSNCGSTVRYCPKCNMCVS